MTEDQGLGGNYYEAYVRRAEVAFTQPDYIERYRSFVREYLASISGPNRNWTYLDNYILDVADLEDRAARNYHVASNAEFKAETAGLPPGKIKEYADRIYENYSRKRFAEEIVRVLREFYENPAETIKNLNNALVACVCRPGDDQYEDFMIPEFQIINVDRNEVEINSITPEMSGNLVQLSGVVSYLSDPPEMEYTQMAYLCNACGNSFTTDVHTKTCPACGKNEVDFLPDDPETLGRNFQESILQENVEDLGRSIASINMRFYGRLINQFQAGDRVKVVGTVTVKRVPKKNSYLYWIDVISCRNVDVEVLKITAEDRKEIEQFRNKSPDVLSALAEMFVPGIVGYTEVKKAMILQAVSGVERRFPDRTERGRIHILLAGDPGKAKSQFLLANRQIEQKSYYISDTSKAGLTVAVSNIGQKRVLIPGIMVLANGGTACIDELDKMQKEDREGLHTAMEQGTISKSKAGLRGIFKANTSVLAAANPAYGRFDLGRDIQEQLKIEASLLDRFDLIFWFIDKPQTRNEVMEMAMKILQPKPTVMPDFIKKYIKVASAIEPAIDMNAAQLISAAYADIKEASPNSISIGMRSMHAIRRLSEASAKLRFSNVVEEIDVQTARELIIESIKPIGFDLDRLKGPGHSVRRIIEQIRQLVRDMGGRAQLPDLASRLEGMGLKPLDIQGAIDAMKRNGELYEMSHNTLGLVS
ncbi:MAG: ATP-binding protein [Candidatus Thermoplasmatota archaeon]|nr:ATP-binding protein [Candidatus Thermoplasmatota archaeon]